MQFLLFCLLFKNLDWIINLYLKLTALKELSPFEAREVIDLGKINGDSLLTSLNFVLITNEKK